MPGDCRAARLPIFATKKIALILSVFALTAGLVAQAAETGWRAVARKASRDVYYSNFDDAAIHYKQAIAILDKDDPECEEKYDLLINLAYTFIVDKKSQQAKQILDKIGPIIMERNWPDPLIKVRYWRRMANYYAYLDGHTKEYVKANEEAIALWEKSIKGSPDKRVLMRTRLIGHLIARQAWPTAIGFIRDIELIPCPKSQSTRVDRSVDELYAALNDALATMRKKNEWKEAAELASQLQKNSQYFRKRKADVEKLASATLEQAKLHSGTPNGAGASTKPLKGTKKA